MVTVNYISFERVKSDTKGIMTKTPSTDCQVEEDIYPKDKATCMVAQTVPCIRTSSREGKWG